MPIIGLFIALLFACASPVLAQPPLRIHFFDVGQGDAILVQSPSGQNVVYDGGRGRTTMVEHLETVEVTSVALVVASHNHADHIGGLAEVFRRYRPRFYLENGIPATTLTYRGVLDAVAAAGSQLLEPTARRISLGDVALHVVPPPGIPGWDQNNNSVGLIVEYGDFRLSLGGDAEQGQWAWWGEQYPDELRAVDVHKASHHGSSNGDSAAALSRLSPEVVVISAGRNNSYGHPTAKAIGLYGDQGSTVYRTDLQGTILLEVDSSGQYTVLVERGEGPQPPPPPSPTQSPASESLQTACVDLNSASSENLQQIIHVGPVRARSIMQHRAVTPFRSVQDLTQLSGISTGRLRDIMAQGRACVR